MNQTKTDWGQLSTEDKLYQIMMSFQGMVAGFDATLMQLAEINKRLFAIEKQLVENLKDQP